jgi:uncharacterized membrane protein YeaQ/YmgE (transglycosylase-associated protein family)
MVILNCLWVGALAGLVGSRLIRFGRSFAPMPGSVAVGVLGALVGGLAGTRLGGRAGDLPHVEIAAAAIAATVALVLWAIAQRLWIDDRGGDPFNNSGTGEP